MRGLRAVWWLGATGGVVGTHAYLAPEAFDTGQVGPAADMWALGATLFHAVAGRPPFERDTTTATLRAILFENPPAPPCPPPLAEVITGLLTRPVDQRLTSDTAQQKLEQAATQPTAPTPVAPPGQGGWEAHATTVHRQPTLPGGPTAPGGPPVPFGTTPPMPPPVSSSPTQGGPAGFADPGSGQGLPRQPPPTTAPLPSGSWPGSPPPRNNTPLDTGSDAGSGGEDGEVVALEFLNAVNRGDEGTALGMLCPDSRHATDVSEAIAGSATLELDAAVIDNSDTFQAGLDGTVDGETVTLGSISVDNGDTGWCVFFFDVA